MFVIEANFGFLGNCLLLSIRLCVSYFVDIIKNINTRVTVNQSQSKYPSTSISNRGEGRK